MHKTAIVAYAMGFGDILMLLAIAKALDKHTIHIFSQTPVGNLFHLHNYNIIRRQYINNPFNLLKNNQYQQIIYLNYNETLPIAFQMNPNEKSMYSGPERHNILNNHNIKEIKKHIYNKHYIMDIMAKELNANLSLESLNNDFTSHPEWQNFQTPNEPYFAFSNDAGNYVNKLKCSKIVRSDLFQQLTSIIKQKYPKMPLYAVGKEFIGPHDNMDSRFLNGLSFIETVKLIKNSQCLVSSEGGLVYGASATNARCICLNGPTSRLHMHPNIQYVQANVGCFFSPCQVYFGNGAQYLYECMGKKRCMDSIKADQVMERIEGILEQDNNKKGFHLPKR